MNTQTNRTLTAALALALAVGLSACGGEGDAGDGVNPQTPTATQPAEDTSAEPTTDDAEDDTSEATEEDQQTSATDAGDLTATALLAIGTAEDETGGSAYEIDDQGDDGTWEVDVAVDGRSIEVTVSADGTTVVGTEDDDLDEDDKAGLAAATITLQEAIQIAIDEVGGVLDDAELEEEGGAHHWEVEVDGTDRGDDVEVNVSVDGKVLSVER
ncbi:PepSY domain-containing protein [Ornithinimicrobium avium]|uniref:PepSY domain-containing protein n=1 Tax=Ornithinimicrobium avium TaxID=2283195 RepID=A0A345NLH2_9MICO|nr:PepSY domain-containing protein [Ornithinimicrobium avium]AXH95880.1 hypothetical protein DV701_06830 [Ornithinimicrobium avium]